MSNDVPYPQPQRLVNSPLCRWEAIAYFHDGREPAAVRYDHPDDYAAWKATLDLPALDYIREHWRWGDALPLLRRQIEEQSRDG